MRIDGDALPSPYASAVSLAARTPTVPIHGMAAGAITTTSDVEVTAGRQMTFGQMVSEGFVKLICIPLCAAAMAMLLSGVMLTLIHVKINVVGDAPLPVHYQEFYGPIAADGDWYWNGVDGTGLFVHYSWQLFTWMMLLFPPTAFMTIGVKKSPDDDSEEQQAEEPTKEQSISTNDNAVAAVDGSAVSIHDKSKGDQPNIQPQLELPVMHGGGACLVLLVFVVITAGLWWMPSAATYWATRTWTLSPKVLVTPDNMETRWSDIRELRFELHETPEHMARSPLALLVLDHGGLLETPHECSADFRLIEMAIFLKRSATADHPSSSIMKRREAWFQCLDKHAPHVRITALRVSLDEEGNELNREETVLREAKPTE